MKKNYISLLLIIYIIVVSLHQTYGQTPIEYKPLKYSTSSPKSTQEVYIKKLNPKYLSNKKEDIKEVNKFLYSVQLSHIRNAKSKFFIDEPYVKKYLQNILDTICARNELKGKYEVICTRDIAVNAYNMGDNRIYVNMGLLKMMKNEAQIAFLLGHELSHYTLLHVQQKFLAAKKLENDKKLKKEIRDIKKAKYNKTDRSIQLVKSYGYEFARNTRETERAADSLSVIYMSKTDYDMQEGIALLKILELSEKDSSGISIVSFFESFQNSIKKEWVEAKEKFLSFGEKKAIELDKDSLRTHPAIPFRIEQTKNQITYLPTNKKLLFLQPQSVLDSIVYACKMEELEIYKKNKRYAAIAYYSIALLKNFPNELFLQKNIAVAMNDIITSMEKHTIQDHIPVEVDELPDGYKQLLRLLDRVNIDDLKEIYKNYLNSVYAKLIQYPEIKTIYEKINKT